MYQRFDVMGRLTEDPELKLTSSGTPFVDFSIANERDYKNGDERVTDFFRCVAWRGTAEFMEKYFRKGQLVLIEGRMEMQKYTDKDGNKRTAAVVNVGKIHFTGDNRNKETAVAEPDPFAGGGFSVVDEDIPF